MYSLRPANERGHTLTDWLDSFHTFSFGRYYDPQHMGFRDLRVINDDVVAPGKGFDMHPHDNMEIISIVLSRALEHKDSLGSGAVLNPGEVQVMTAGSGIFHSEFNPSSTEPVHFLQIWIMTDRRGHRPQYGQKSFACTLIENQPVLIVSGDGREDSLRINQNVEVYQCLLEENKSADYQIFPEHKYWIQVCYGAVSVNDRPLVAGDGLAVWDEKAELKIRGIDPNSNFLLFRLK